MSQSIGPKVYIDGVGEFKNDLSTMIQATKTFKAELDAINKSDLNPFEKASLSKSTLMSEIEAQKAKIELLKEKLQETADKYGENSKQALKMKESLEKANGALATMEQQLKDIKNPLQIVGDEMQTIGDKLQDAGKKISKVGDTMTTRVSAPIVGAFTAAGKAAIDFESAMTGVQKTVEETVNTSYADLEKAIMDLSGASGVAKEEIAGVMENAGQLGVGADDIAQFTKVMIDLGVSTNLTAEEASSAMAKFANVTKMPLSDVDRLGAAIVDLGNNYATTEADIMNMATRLAGAGAQIGLTQGEILGFATALSSVGIEAEMGGSAFSKAMIKMQVAAETGWDQVIDLQNQTGMSLRELELLSQNGSKEFTALADSLGLTKTEMLNTVKAGLNLQDFAEVAQMSTKDFVELYRSDAPAALQAFIKGLGDTESHGETTIAMLQEMGFTEVRLRDTLTRLAQSSDLVTDAVKRGNEAWEENAALEEEANKRYNTTENRLLALKERLGNLAIELGERLLPYVDKFIDFADKMMEKWDGLDQDTQDAIVKALALTAAIGPILSVGGRLITGIGMLTSGAGSLISGIGGITGALGGIASAGGIAAGGFAAVSAAAGPLLIGGTIVLGIAAAAGQIIAHWDLIKETAENLKKYVPEAWETLKARTAESWGQMKESVSSSWQNIRTSTSESLAEIGNKISDTWQNAQAKTEAAFDDMKQKIHDRWEEMKTKTAEATDAIGEKIRAKWDEAKEKTTTAFREIGESIKTGMSEAATAVQSKADEIGEKIRTRWEEAKTKTRESWDTMKSKISDAVSAMKTDVDNSVTNIKNKFVTDFEYLKGQASSWGTNIMTNLSQAIWSGLNWIKDGVSSIGSAFSDGLSNIISNAWNWGKDLMANLSQGIWSGVHWVSDAVSSVASKIRGFLHFSEPDYGPLADASTYMPDFMKLLAKGIYQNMSIVENAADALAGALLPDVSALSLEATGAGGNNTTVTNGDVVINVYGSAGQSVDELAEVVAQKMIAVNTRRLYSYG